MPRCFFILLSLALALCAYAKDPAVPCPEGLAEVAAAHRLEMNRDARDIHESTAAAPLGMAPMQAFDRVEHNCHEVAGQVYRLFDEPRCVRQETEFTWSVDYDFALFYRQGETHETLFSEPWGQGSDGIWRVRFEQQKEGWVPIAEKEILDLSSSDKHGY